MCHYLFKFLDKNVVSRAVSSLSDTECNGFESQLSEWSAQIKDETIFLMAQGIEEQRSLIESFRSLSKVDEARRLAKARTRVLDACSTYSYEASWKRLRKKGDTRLFDQIGVYGSWKATAPSGTPSTTLALTGSLGSGKSVLAANMVEDLGAVARASNIPLLYFFCEYGTSQSINARVILGSIVRQLLQSISFTPPQDLSKYELVLEELDGMVDLVKDVVPSGQMAFCIIDGIYECDEENLEGILDALASLQSVLRLHVCLNFRLEATTRSILEELQLRDVEIVIIPDNSEDIENFIGDELERCIENDLLKLGDPALVEEILLTLTNEAKGMFLWAELQISALCWTSSDREIRRALQSLPKTLAETFERVLERAASHGLAGHDNQRKILSHMVAAARPLTKDEMGDMLGITPFDLIWSPDQVCTNVDNMLAACGSLIAVDEETFAVHFIHSSAKKFLLERKGNDALTYEKSNTELAELTVTYLNYNIFQTELIRAKDANGFQAGSAPAKVIQSSMPSGTIKNLSLRLLRAKKHQHSSSTRSAPSGLPGTGATIDFDHVINGDRDKRHLQANANRIAHPFYGYALDFWAHHAAESTTIAKQYGNLLRKTIPRYLNKDKHALEMYQVTLNWADEEALEVLALVLNWFTEASNEEVRGLAARWIRHRLHLDEHHLRALIESGSEMYYTMNFRVDDHLEHLICLAASLGDINVLDIFLYRASCLDSFRHDILAQYAMVAIYKDQYEAAKHIAMGEYSRIFKYMNPGDVEQTPTPPSAYETTLQKLGLWAAIFAKDECYRDVSSWAATPLEWLPKVRQPSVQAIIPSDDEPFLVFFRSKLHNDGERTRFSIEGGDEIARIEIEHLRKTTEKMRISDIRVLEKAVVQNSDKQN